MILVYLFRVSTVSNTLIDCISTFQVPRPQHIPTCSNACVYSSRSRGIRLCSEHGLIPAPKPSSNPAPDRHNEYWCICGDLGFNPLLPQCDGRITAMIPMRHYRKGPKPQFRGAKCRKQLSQLHGTTQFGRPNSVKAGRSQGSYRDG